jgi:hypothetical protein
VAVRPGLTEAIGDALLALVEWAAPRLSWPVDQWVESVADAVRPDPPMTIRTLEGLVLTGLLVCDAGQVILFIGTRAPPSNGFTSAASPRPDPRDPRSCDDGSIPLWARDVDPREMRDLDVDAYRRR